MYEIRFGENLEKSSRVFAAPTMHECNQKLAELTKHTKYTRMWKEGDYVVTDYGSWSTFYFVGEAREGEKVMDRPTMKDMFRKNYQITDFLDMMINNHLCFRRYETYTGENGDMEEMTFYEIIVGYTNVGNDYLVHVVSAENINSPEAIKYEMIHIRWLKDVINDIGIDIPDSDQFEVEGEQK